jgi:ABC-type spermidine/putrescine transport system permease subunit I
MFRNLCLATGLYATVIINCLAFSSVVYIFVLFISFAQAYFIIGLWDAEEARK